MDSSRQPVFVTDAVVNTTAQAICETGDMYVLFDTFVIAFTEEDGLTITAELFEKLRLAASSIQKMKVTEQMKNAGSLTYIDPNKKAVVGEISNTALNSINLTEEEINLLETKRILKTKTQGNMRLILSPGLFHFCNMIIISDSITELVTYFAQVDYVVDKSVNKHTVDQVVLPNAKFLH